MKLLLLKGADIEAKSVHGTPLQIVTSNENAELVEFLLRRGATVRKVIACYVECQDTKSCADFCAVFRL